MTEEISERINQRRRQILVHSVIYYKYNDSIISDDKWISFAKELRDLQEQYPKIAAACEYAEEFDRFDYSSGYDLPLDNEWVNVTAQRLLYLRNKS